MRSAVGLVRRGLLEGLPVGQTALVIGRPLPGDAATGVERQIVEPNPFADRFSSTTVYECDSNGKCVSMQVSQEPASSYRTITLDPAGRVIAISE